MPEELKKSFKLDGFINTAIMILVCLGTMAIGFYMGVAQTSVTLHEERVTHYQELNRNNELTARDLGRMGARLDGVAEALNAQSQEIKFLVNRVGRLENDNQ